MMEAHRFGGPWTVEKLDAVRVYLSAYAQALKNQPFRRNYLDAFAGTGDRAVKRQEAQTVLDDLLAQSELGLGVDDLPPADDFPQAIDGIGVAHRNIAAGFEAVRDHSAVPAILQPLPEFAKLPPAVAGDVDQASKGGGVGYS